MCKDFSAGLGFRRRKGWRVGATHMNGKECYRSQIVDVTRQPYPPPGGAVSAGFPLLRHDFHWSDYIGACPVICLAH